MGQNISKKSFKASTHRVVAGYPVETPAEHKSREKENMKAQPSGDNSDNMQISQGAVTEISAAMRSRRIAQTKADQNKSEALGSEIDRINRMIQQKSEKGGFHITTLISTSCCLDVEAYFQSNGYKTSRNNVDKHWTIIDWK